MKPIMEIIKIIFRVDHFSDKQTHMRSLIREGAEADNYF